jgi:hypothetical protein
LACGACQGVDGEEEALKNMKANTKPKTATQRDAVEFLRATTRLLKTFKDNPPQTDEGFAYASTTRTFLRIIRGIEEAKTDLQLAAEMKLSIELLRDLQIIGFHAAEDQILFDEPDPEGHMARAQDLMELIEELEAIHNRERD